MRRSIALDDYSRALLETEFYIRSLDEGHPKDIEKEKEIANLWRVSALTISILDEDMKERNSDKMYYWIQGAIDDVDAIEKKGISIPQMREKLKELIEKSA